MAIGTVPRAAQSQWADFWSLLKVKQTMLLLFTALCACALTRGWPLPLLEALWMGGGLFLAIGGCTVLNLLLDRDIDARLGRTAGRAIPAGRIRPAEAAVSGGVLSLLGLILSLGLDLRFGAVVTLGFARFLVNIVGTPGWRNVLGLVLPERWLRRRSALADA